MIKEGARIRRRRGSGGVEYIIRHLSQFDTHSEPSEKTDEREELEETVNPEAGPYSHEDRTEGEEESDCETHDDSVGFLIVRKRAGIEADG